MSNPHEQLSSTSLPPQSLVARRLRALPPSTPTSVADRYYPHNGVPAEAQADWQLALKASVSRWHRRYHVLGNNTPEGRYPRPPFVPARSQATTNSLRGYPKPELRWSDDLDQSGSKTIEGVGFSEADKANCFDFFDAVWVFVEENYAELMSYAGDQDTHVLDQMISNLLPNLEIKLKNNPLFTAFSEVWQQRTQNGSIKHPYKHSIKVFRNIIRQNLFATEELEVLGNSEYLPSGINQIAFWSLVLALIHDIGNMFFLDNDVWHLHALFGQVMSKQWLVERKNVPEDVAAGLSAPIGKHHLFEAAALKKIPGPELTADLNKLPLMNLFSLIFLAIADASSTNRLSIEYENLCEQVKVVVASLHELSESHPEVIKLYSLVLIKRIEQLTDIAQDPSQRNQTITNPRFAASFGQAQVVVDKIARLMEDAEEVIRTIPEIRLLLNTLKTALVQLFGLDQPLAPEATA